MQISTEFIVPSDTEIFHYSRSLDELIKSGRFDPVRGAHNGAMFFTPERVRTSNCVARISEQLKMFDFTELPKDELEVLRELGNGDWWHGAASVGYDGRSFLTADPFAEIAEGQFCHELVLFKDSLTKITDLRRIESKS